jgi:DNA-directed RNA polymerase subunit M/transcription elongation factor TFIIS
MTAPPLHEFRVIRHAPVCPDCGSHAITEEDLDIADGTTETAYVCTACGAAWPIACIAEPLTSPGIR